jgi:hypothetical protein
VNGEATKISVNRCINWLANSVSSEEDKEKMRNNPLIQDLMEEIQAFLECEADVDMLDPATWKNTPYAKEFARAEELIWNAIAPRAAHQQRVENLVQIAGHLGKTNVSEARRSARAKIHSLFYRDFNQWALEIERKADAQKAAEFAKKYPGRP